VVTLLPRWPYVTLPSESVPAPVARAVTAGDPVVLTYPFPTLYNMQPMIWQADDGFGFRLLGGYAYHPLSSGGPTVYPSIMSPPQLQQFLDGNGSSNPLYGPAIPVSRQLVATTKLTLATNHVRVVVVDRSVQNSGRVMKVFEDALGRPKLTLGQYSLWSGWHGIREPKVSQNLQTAVVLPANGKTLSGTTVLDAATTDHLRVRSVEFQLTDATQHTDLIAVGRPSYDGWIAKWNTASVPSGTYTLQSVAHDSGGRTSYSTLVTIAVQNQ
jgi:hypothetical protein